MDLTRIYRRFQAQFLTEDAEELGIRAKATEATDGHRPESEKVRTARLVS